MSSKPMQPLFGVVLLLAVWGCSHKEGQKAVGPQPQVLLQAYNPLTNERLGGVEVIRWDWKWTLGAPVEPVVPTPAGATGIDGLYLSDVSEFAPTFMLHKAGYGSAEVRVDGDEAFVASPSEGDRWSRSDVRVFGFVRIPVLQQTRYERYVRSRPLVRVPMWPTDAK